MVIHMTRREGRRFVEEAAFVSGYDAKARTNGTLRESRSEYRFRTTENRHSTGKLIGVGAFSIAGIACVYHRAPNIDPRSRPASFERVIDGDTIQVRFDR